MTAEQIPAPAETLTLADLLAAGVGADRLSPEGKIVVTPISWERYLKIDATLGEDRSSPRTYYLDDSLELMTLSREHERIKVYVHDLLAIYFGHMEMEVIPHGQATMRDVFKRAGAEPDDSWSLHEEKTVPDLVFEVALTSGGLPKQDIYRRFAVPEVWLWKNDSLGIFVFDQAGGDYRKSVASQLLPGLNLELLAQCVQISSWREARKTFLAGL